MKGDAKKIAFAKNERRCSSCRSPVVFLRVIWIDDSSQTVVKSKSVEYKYFVVLYGLVRFALIVDLSGNAKYSVRARLGKVS
jgi:hypothetical protein